MFHLTPARSVDHSDWVMVPGAITWPYSQEGIDTVGWSGVVWCETVAGVVCTYMPHPRCLRLLLYPQLALWNGQLLCHCYHGVPAGFYVYVWWALCTDGWYFSIWWFSDQHPKLLEVSTSTQN